MPQAPMLDTGCFWYLLTDQYSRCIGEQTRMETYWAREGRYTRTCPFLVQICNLNLIIPTIIIVHPMALDILYAM